MRISAPGNSARGWTRASENGRPSSRAARTAGFTLIEVIVVMALIAIATSLVGLALRDGTQGRLDEEGARLTALLESARAEARASGITVSWVPADAAAAADGAHFRFVGLPPGITMPSRWLVEGVSAEIVGARALLLGPEPVLPAQRLVLHLDDRRLVLTTDGLSPFGPSNGPDTP
jgi:general secretion pathway protein H